MARSVAAAQGGCHQRVALFVPIGSPSPLIQIAIGFGIGNLGGHPRCTQVFYSSTHYRLLHCIYIIGFWGVKCRLISIGGDHNISGISALKIVYARLQTAHWDGKMTASTSVAGFTVGDGWYQWGVPAHSTFGDADTAIVIDAATRYRRFGG